MNCQHEFQVLSESVLAVLLEHIPSAFLRVSHLRWFLSRHEALRPSVPSVADPEITPDALEYWYSLKPSAGILLRWL